jgi:hypothetical protein
MVKDGATEDGPPSGEWSGRAEPESLLAAVA